ncbi:MAG TPA: hypothetical protein VFQ65_27340 [Kofleriaceae bacterium]|nr:hypothetical protein [Kofleriaceae bacterium]
MANELALVAIAWHVVIALALVVMLRGWRPSARVTCVVLTAPILSVGLASLAYGNAFNAISFMLLALVLAVLGDGLMAPHGGRGPSWTTWAGVAAMAFGLVYPHFVDGPWYRVLAAAPLGVVPCPTLSFVGGAVIVAGGFGSRAIPLVLAVWVAFYALFGIVQLGVTLDVGLLVAMVGLVAVLVHNAALARRVHTTIYSARNRAVRTSRRRLAP